MLYACAVFIRPENLFELAEQGGPLLAFRHLAAASIVPGDSEIDA
jgi:hypothetical protein